VYECARGMAVRTVPGAVLRWRRNQEPWRAINTSSGYQGIGLRSSSTPAYWEVGDTIEFEARLCARTSGVGSGPVIQPPPSSLAAPVFEPPDLYEGQSQLILTDLTLGSFARMNHSQPNSNPPVPERSIGVTQDASTGTAWFDLSEAMGRPAQDDDVVRAEPSLFCPTGPSGPSAAIGPPLPCADLPAPEILDPRVGDDYVIVTKSLPGARIRVRDATGEIGDGTVGGADALMVRLIRAVRANDLLTVIQEVEGCRGINGYRAAPSLVYQTAPD